MPGAFTGGLSGTWTRRIERPAPPYMEFLIDRFGYVRLRGKSDDETLSPANVLLVQAAYLAEEPQLRPPPDEHVH